MARRGKGSSHSTSAGKGIIEHSGPEQGELVDIMDILVDEYKFHDLQQVYFDRFPIKKRFVICNQCKWHHLVANFATRKLSLKLELSKMDTNSIWSTR